MADNSHTTKTAIAVERALIMNQDELLLPILGMFIPRLGMFKILGQAHAHHGASPWVQ